MQQTQVAVVIGYYQRFMQSFPGIQALAEADLDQVLHHWSGLGYYARARNLHRAARLIADQHQGEFPDQMEEILALPGIGRSTAGAILSLAFAQPFPILDGNVRRVLARCFLVGGWTGQAAVQRQLWQISAENTPQQRTGEFNQAMMDLGATVCVRSNPDCHLCPLEADCLASQQGLQSDYPEKKPRCSIPERSTQMLLIRSGDEILLERRPETGVWGGLWSFPELALDQDPLDWCLANLSAAMTPMTLGSGYSARRHTFSHFHLDIHPVEILLEKQGSQASQIMEQDKGVWYKLPSAEKLGLAAPVSRLLQEIQMNELKTGDNTE